MSESNKGGIFKGKSHAEGGIPLVVPETGQQLEVESNEPLIPNEALESSEIKEYTGTNFQILDKINKSIGAKGLSEKATEIHAGDVIICKRTLQDKTIKTLKGTHRQIVSAINVDSGCNVIEKGGTITDEEGNTKQFKGGGSVAESQLEKGIEHEHEHRGLYLKLKARMEAKGVNMVMSEEQFYKEIAQVHIDKKPKFYNLLEKMDKGGNVSESQLKQGVEIEKEHNDIYLELKRRLDFQNIEMPMSKEEFFERIAIDHIEEIPKYYTFLKKMEEEAKQMADGGEVLDGNRFFEIIYQKEWKTEDFGFFASDNHLGAIKQINPNVKRITNERFRDIEKTGEFYYVEEQGKGGKTLIFEVISNEMADGGETDSNVDIKDYIKNYYESNGLKIDKIIRAKLDDGWYVYHQYGNESKAYKPHKIIEETDFKNIVQTQPYKIKSDFIEDEKSEYFIDSLQINVMEAINRAGIKGNLIELEHFRMADGGAIKGNIHFINDDKYEEIVDKIKVELDKRCLKNHLRHISKSETDYGKSWYLKFGEPNKEYTVEEDLQVRISDHSVHSLNRVLDFKYIAFVNAYDSFDEDNAKKIVDEYLRRNNYIKEQKQKKSNAFDRADKRRLYITEKSNEFLSKLTSEGKAIFYHPHTRLTIDDIKNRYATAEHIFQFSSKLGGYEYYWVNKANGYGKFYLEPNYFNFLINEGVIDADKVEEVIRYGGGGSTEKRYVAEAEYYVHANNDKEAEAEARKITSEIDKKYDNRATVEHLYEQQFGKLGSRKVFKDGGNVGKWNVMYRKTNDSPLEYLSKEPISSSEAKELMNNFRNSGNSYYELFSQVSIGFKNGGSVDEYQNHKIKKKELNDLLDKYSDVLNSFPKGEMGLLPDEIRNTIEFKEANSNYKKAFKELQEFNKNTPKEFKIRNQQEWLSERISNAQKK